jgi:hypothetical protein
MGSSSRCWMARIWAGQRLRPSSRGMVLSLPRTVAQHESGGLCVLPHGQPLPCHGRTRVVLLAWLGDYHPALGLCEIGMVDTYKVSRLAVRLQCAWLLIKEWMPWLYTGFNLLSPLRTTTFFLS